MTEPSKKVSAAVKPEDPGVRAIRWASVVVGLLLTAGMVVLGITVMQRAGALWRDEVHTVNLVSLPTLGDLLQHWWWDSSLIVFQLALRGWIGLGLGGSDVALRGFPFMALLAIAALLWWNARQFGYRVPLISLALLGLSPVMFHYGSEVRGYCFAVATLLLMIGSLWGMVRNPTWPRAALAAVGAILAVQSIYNNVPIFAGVWIAAAAVCLFGRRWRTLGLLIGVGVLAALSIVPYLGMYEHSKEWVFITRREIGLSWVLGVFIDSVNTDLSTGFMIWIWIALAVITVASCAYRLNRHAPDQPPRQKDMALFILVAVLITPVLYFAYLRFVGLRTQPWYYLPVMTVLAVSFDVAAYLMVRESRAGLLARVALAALLTLVMAQDLWRAAQIRWTNVDQVATEIRAAESPGDLVLLNPWYVGLTFNRYYKGNAAWITLPEVKDQQFHAYPELIERMKQTKPIQSVLDRIGQTLQAGHRVWLVGGLDFLPPGQQPGDLPPAPNSPYGWSEGAYSQLWSRQTAYFIQTHALKLRHVPLPTNGPVWPYEDMQLLVIEGWHD